MSRQEKYISSISSPSFPVSNRKFTRSENNVILDNKIRVLIKNSIQLQSGIYRISKNHVLLFFSPHPTTDVRVVCCYGKQLGN